MIKKYWKWQFSRWWPVLLIFGVLLVSTAFLVCSVESLVDSSYSPNGTQFYYRGSSAVGVELYIIFALALVPAFVMPFLVFSYRTKKQSVDIFYQAAYKPGTIKRIRLLLGLIIIVVAFTLAYIVGILILGIRYAATPEFAERIHTSNAIYRENRAPVNFAIYILAYFVLLAALVGEYFVNCFLVGLGDYVLDQIFLLIGGNIFLCLGLYAPFLYEVTLMGLHQSGQVISNDLMNLFTMPSGTPTFFFIDTPIISLLRYKSMDNGRHLTNTIGYLVFLIFSGGLCVYNFLHRDPSGEYANLRGARNKVVALIPHGAAFSIGMMLAVALVNSVRFGGGVTNYFVLPFFSLIMLATAYYALLALWRHSFKPSRIDLICFLSVNGSITLALIAGITIAAVGGSGGSINY